MLFRSPGFAGSIKAACNAPQALLVALSAQQGDKHKLYGFNLTLLTADFNLLEEVIEHNVLKIYSMVQAAGISSISFKEKALSAEKQLPIQEQIITYTEGMESCGLTEKSLKPNQDFEQLSLYERSCFKPGEWGEGTLAIRLRPSVVDRPYKSLTLADKVIAKPAPIITEATNDAYYTYDNFNAYSWDLVEKETRPVTNKPTILSHPSPLYETLTTSPIGYDSYGYQLTFRMPAYNRKRVLAIPKTSKISPIEVIKKTYVDDTGSYAYYERRQRYNERLLCCRTS